MKHYNNKPLWLIITLIVIAVLVVLMSQTIQSDSTTDDVSHEAATSLNAAPDYNN